MTCSEDSKGLTVKELFIRVWRNIRQHEVLTRTSAIAFSSMMASVPFLILALTAFIYLLPNLSAAGSLGIGNLTPEQVQAFLHAVFPPDVANVIAGQITHIQEQPPVGLLSVSIIVLLWMSSTVFVDIMDALNKIYGVRETRPYWRLRLWAMVIMIVQLAIGLFALVLILAWPQLLDLLHLTGAAAHYATVLKWIIVPLTIMGSMAVIFHMGPASHQRGRWVTPGSVFGTIVFLSATLLFREYVQNFAQYNRIYGSLGGVMALMFWFWLSSLVLLVAAEMNKVIEYAVTRTQKKNGSPKETAGGKEEAQVVKTDCLPDAGPQGQATVVEPETIPAAHPPAQANPADTHVRTGSDSNDLNDSSHSRPRTVSLDANGNGDATGSQAAATDVKPVDKDPQGNADSKV